MSDPIGEMHTYGVDIKTREIYLHGQHGSFEDDPGVEYRMATTFIKNLRFLDAAKKEPILIHMHSLGGNWGDGMAIYDAICACRSHITILAYGQAESMSSIILQSADNRVMMPNAYFMSHFGNSNISGSYLDSQNWAKFENVILDVMMDIYTEKCSKGKYFQEKYKEVTSKKVKSFLMNKLKQGDWYINAHESVYYVFSDGVLGGRKFPSISKLK